MGILSDYVNLQIRIVNGNEPTRGRIDFTNLETYYVEFNIPPHQIYDHTLNETEKEAVYNEIMGVSNKSIHITTDHQVSVYAMNSGMGNVSMDATNVLPVTTLGTDYYHISNAIFPNSWYYYDAYAVVAIANNTHVYHDGISTATLNIGEVYYRKSPYPNEMTGAHITSDKPVALFALNNDAAFPSDWVTSNNLF